MRLDDDTLSISPSDLSQHLGCAHATTLAMQVARGTRGRPPGGGEYERLIRDKGDVHEQEYLERLRASGVAITEISRSEGGLGEMAARTRSAMIEGAEAIYQATFVRGRWRGLADFLERVPGQTALGDYGYEAVDTKLARNEARPSHVLQLCFYSAGIEEVQGVLPAAMHIELGSGRRESLRPRDFDAYFARARTSLERFVDGDVETTPYPCTACAQCSFIGVCDAVWRAKDDLSFVAGIRRSQTIALEEAGVDTLRLLADPAVIERSTGLPLPTLAGLHLQAGLQAATAETGTIATHVLPLEPGRGFARLAAPSRLDMAIDLEGDPFWRADRDLTFMFGLYERGPLEWTYRAEWAHDELGEQRLAGGVIDAIHERLLADPGMHVYHYGAVEVSVLKRICMLGATHEEQLDQLLRRRVFVDVSQAVRQSIRLGLESYGLKSVERLPGFVRVADVGRGADAVLEYEHYLATGDPAHLAAIERYNAEDCRSTVEVVDWLRAQAPDGVEWLQRADGSRDEDDAAAAARTARDRLREALIEGEQPGSERWLAGELLAYHRRAAKPQWWEYFARLEMSAPELLADGTAIAGLELHRGLAAIPIKRSLAFPMTFPAQEHRAETGDKLVDPDTGQSREVVELDPEARIAWVKRGAGSTDPHPRALIPGGPPGTVAHQDALERFACSVRDRTGEFPALERLLRNDLPVLAGRVPGACLQTTDMREMRDQALALDSSTLVIQGPPGTGKTYRGARLISELVRAGARVGLTAFSHKAIDNLCEAVESAAREEGLAFVGTRHGTQGHDGALITAASGGDYAASQVVAATSWHFAPGKTDHAFDYLVIDEAGQFALADALAAGTAARNLILLGDPSQLSQVVQGTHPEGSDASALGHVLGDHDTIPVDRGIFLDVSWRMRPDICSFISSEFYEGRLRSHDRCAARATSAGTGLRMLGVEHRGNASCAPEEVEAIRLEIAGLLHGSLTTAEAEERAIVPDDIMVVTPYNAQAHALKRALPDGVRVGTVDRFQGQEAPIVFFSMATSSGEDAPRDAGFLFSRHRLNVAISRAQALAYLVCSPALLDSRAGDVEDMRLINTLCRLAAVARP
jgi:predicted RecB family nuclease